MQKYTSISNQFAYGVGYRNSKIQDSHRHLLWVNFGYKSFSLAWHKNPKLPAAEIAKHEGEKHD